METIAFFNYFNSVKPSLEEMTNSNPETPIEVLKTLMGDYDLRVVDDKTSDSALIGLIVNTNIADLYFSPVRFYNNITNDQLLKIGQVIEKGDLFYNRSNKKVTFTPMYDDDYLWEGEIDELDFLNFVLKFFEAETNAIVRKHSGISFTKYIPLSEESIVNFPVFVELLEERSIDLDQILP